MQSIPLHRGDRAKGRHGAREGLMWCDDTYQTSHSSVLSTLWDTGIHWNGCKLLHSGIYSSASSLVHTCHYGRLTTENRKLYCIVWHTKGWKHVIKPLYIYYFSKTKYRDKLKWCSTHPSHSGSQTSRWRRSSRKGLVGRSEAPCSSARSHMTAGSFGQTFLLCRLQAIRERQIHKCVYLNSLSFAVSCLNLLCRTPQRTV